ncbi:MAG: M23 family metallopeptidase [Sulfurovum sp.]
MKISKIAFIYILFSALIYGAKLTSSYWIEGSSFREYLTSQNLPLDILSSISKDDKKLLSNIDTKELIYELRDGNGTIIKSLIPIDERTQVILSHKRNKKGYNFDIIPIFIKEKEYKATIVIDKGSSSKNSHLKALKKEIKKLSRGILNTKRLKNNDTIFILYNQKTRLGLPFYSPNIKAIQIKSKKRKRFIYVGKDGYGYQKLKNTPFYERKIVKPTSKSTFRMPLRNVRITSSFSYRRYHPILKRYRPHHGTDFGARHGTPLLAVNAGVVTFSGKMGGYGNVIKIRHLRGYETLYAHQSRRRVKRGARVKKGQIIGYVGSTGRSTGPHLHFGMKRYGRWIDPMKVLRKKSIPMSRKKTMTVSRKIRIKDGKERKSKLIRYIKSI